MTRLLRQVDRDAHVVGEARSMRVMPQPANHTAARRRNPAQVSARSSGWISA
jgi:hypothetical protein